jgi:acylphosphatase
VAVIRRNVRVRGQVQGVFFRDSVRTKAEKHGVAGFVRNCRDGSVEVELEGEPGAVAAVIDFCRSGPRHAYVEEIEVSQRTPRDDPLFRVL